MMQPEFLLITFTTLGGVLLGGLIGGVGHFIKWSRERRMALNRLLYDLLEIRFQLSRSNPDSLADALRTVIAKQFGTEVAKSLYSSEALEFIRETLRDLAHSSGPSTMTNGYESSVDAIAPFDPLLAYRLRGKSELWKYEQAIQKYYEGILSHPQSLADSSLQQSGPIMESATLKLVYNKLLDALGDDCISVARRLAPIPLASRILRETKTALKRQTDNQTSDLEAMVAELFQSLGSNPSMEGA